MATVRTIAALFGMALLVGACADSTGRVGGVDQTTVRGPSGERLTVVKPRNIDLKRGEAESFVVELRRRNFSDEVKVTVSKLPRGVEAVDAPRKTTSDEVEIVLRASEGADLVGNHQALVTAEGPDGIQATETLQISVRERS